MLGKYNSRVRPGTLKASSDSRLEITWIVTDNGDGRVYFLLNNWVLHPAPCTLHITRHAYTYGTRIYNVCMAGVTFKLIGYIAGTREPLSAADDYTEASGNSSYQRPAACQWRRHQTRGE